MSKAKEGKGEEAAGNTNFSEMDWLCICFRQSQWLSAKQADSFQVSSSLLKKSPHPSFMGGM